MIISDVIILINTSPEATESTVQSNTFVEEDDTTVFVAEDDTTVFVKED